MTKHILFSALLVGLMASSACTGEDDHTHDTEGHGTESDGTGTTSDGTGTSTDSGGSTGGGSTTGGSTSGGTTTGGSTSASTTSGGSGSTTAGSTGGVGLEIVGEYADNFGGMHAITEETWDDGYGLYHIQSFDNEVDFLVAQNDSGNDFNPDLFSRFDWVETMEGKLYYCQIAFDKATAAEAEAVTDADDSDPATGGCGGFSWTELIAQ